MAGKSLSSQTKGLVTTTVLVGGKEIKDSHGILSITILRAFNKVSSAKLKIRDGGTTSPDDFSISNSKDFDPGKEIEIKVGYSSNVKTIFKGVVVKHSLKIVRGVSALYVECKDPIIAMTIGRKNAIFQKKSDSEIISEVLGTYSGISKDIDSTSYKHPEMVQHYTTDWDFIVMRAEANGLLVSTVDGKLEIKAPKVSESPVVSLENGTDIISFQGDIDVRTQLPSVTSVSWDMANQKIVSVSSNSADEVAQSSLKSKTLAGVIGLKTYALQSAANVPREVLEPWAKAKHLKASLSKVRGRVKFKGIADVLPGNVIEIVGLSDQFNGKAYVGGLEHRIEAGTWVIDAQLGVSAEWYAEETPNVNTAEASALFPPIRGLQTAVVKSIIDPDKSKADDQFRVLVALPTLEKDNLNVWARLSNFYATENAGLFFYPEVGDEVIIGFLNDNPQDPIILGSVYSSKRKPASAYKPEKTGIVNPKKALVTKAELKVEFDDEKKIITIETPGKNLVIMDDDKKSITIKDTENKNTMTMSSKGIAMESDGDITLTAKGNIKMEAKSNIEGKATADVKMEGVNVTAKGSAKFAAEGAQAEVKGSAQTTIKGGMVMIN